MDYRDWVIEVIVLVRPVLVFHCYQYRTEQKVILNLKKYKLKKRIYTGLTNPDYLVLPL